MRATEDSWQEETLFLESSKVFAAQLACIDKATRSIDIEMYIFNLDIIGRPVAQALIRAADRGVRVRLLVDSLGSAASAGDLENIFAPTPLELRFYHRFFERGWLSSLRRLNRRNHRKIWIFDDSLAFVGSGNVTREHLPVSEGGDGWKDAYLQVQGADGITVLRESFEVAWTKPHWLPGKGRRPKARDMLKSSEGHDGDLVHMNDTRARRKSLRIENRKRMERAAHRIWLANPYFAPHASFVRALRKAAQRGVDVKILVPKRSDVFFMPLLMFTYFKVLLEAGVKIYQYQPSIYHAKIRIIDGCHILGSSNLDFRSLLYNLEVDVLVTHRENQKNLESDLNNDFSNSKPITLESIRNTSIWIRMLSSVISLVRYWV